MNVTVFSIIYNEFEMLPYFLRHYGRIADQIVLYDNQSDDDAYIEDAMYAQRLRGDNRAAVCCHKITTGGALNDTVYTEIYNTCWKHSASDWVILVACDEFVIINREQLAKEREKGVRIVVCDGFNVYSDKEFRVHPKEQIYEQHRIGKRFQPYSKPCVFDPRLDMSIGVGNHNVQLNRDEGGLFHSFRQYKLLHYGTITWDYFHYRSELYRRRMSLENIQKGYGQERMNTTEADYRKESEGAEEILLD